MEEEMMNVRRKNLIVVPSFMAIAVCAVMGVFVCTLQAEVTTFRFEAITSNDPCNAATGEEQLYMDVFNSGNFVKFRFRNEGPVHSSITGIWFDDGSLLGISQIIDMETIGDADPCTIDGHIDVDFEPDGNQNLPGASGMEYPFVAIKGFTVKSDPPPPANGVESNDPCAAPEYQDQWVQIEFELEGGQTLANVLDELMTGDPYPTLRVGLHVQSFNGTTDTSESFVNIVPEPVTICLFGLGGLALLRKRKK
jgi:hypothetical protein